MTPPEEISASQRMHEIIERRDEIRRQSEERVKQGLTPFPTAEKVRELQRERSRGDELRFQRELIERELEELKELG